MCSFCVWILNKLYYYDDYLLTITIYSIVVCHSQLNKQYLLIPTLLFVQCIDLLSSALWQKSNKWGALPYDIIFFLIWQDYWYIIVGFLGGSSIAYRKDDFRKSKALMASNRKLDRLSSVMPGWGNVMVLY